MRTRTLTMLATAAAGAAIAFAACSDTPSVPTPPGSLQPSFAKGGSGAKTVKSIAVTPSSATVNKGGTTQLTASANPAGSVMTFAWGSSNNAIATVSSTGLVTAIASGSATISATGGGKTGTSAITVPADPPPAGSEVLVGAGDIASCSSNGDELTANVLDGITGTVFTLGDNAYTNATTAEYTNCYNPSWGRHKARTRPSPGNHEYQTAGAAGYFGYFGSAAGTQGEGYYSYNLGDWHIIVLNSNSECTTISCAKDSPQEKWLRADLQANTKACVLAYWHHPRFNSGLEHANSTAVAPFWNALYEYGAEVILNGHEHLYERFAPQTPAAVANATTGIRQFTVGTGGNGHYGFGTIQPNSEVRNNTAYGVLRLTLKPGGYDWDFVPAAGSTFTDSGSGTCH